MTISHRFVSSPYKIQASLNRYYYEDFKGCGIWPGYSHAQVPCPETFFGSREYAPRVL